MKKRNFLPFTKLIVLLFAAVLFNSCIKNNNFIKGDAKVRIFQSSSTDTTQNFFINGRPSGSVTTYGTNSSYIVVGGDSTYNFSSRAITEAVDNATLNQQKLLIGKNYSLFLTRKTTTTPSNLVLYEDDVRKSVDSVKLIFIHFGHTLGSSVNISDAGNSFTTFSMVYGNRSTKMLKVNDKTKISFVLSTPTPTNPQPVVKALDATTLTNGFVYTVIIDGSKSGELQNRLVTSN